MLTLFTVDVLIRLFAFETCENPFKRALLLKQVLTTISKINRAGEVSHKPTYSIAAMQGDYSLKRVSSRVVLPSAKRHGFKRKQTPCAIMKRRAHRSLKVDSIHLTIGWHAPTTRSVLVKTMLKSNASHVCCFFYHLNSTGLTVLLIRLKQWHKFGQAENRHVTLSISTLLWLIVNALLRPCQRIVGLLSCYHCTSATRLL